MNDIAERLRRIIAMMEAPTPHMPTIVKMLVMVRYDALKIRDAVQSAHALVSQFLPPEDDHRDQA